MHKRDLALNNLRWLIFHKTKPNQFIRFFLLIDSMKKKQEKLFEI